MDSILFRAILRSVFASLALLWNAGAYNLPAKPPEAPHRVIVGLSPFLDRAVKDDVYRRLVTLLVQELPGGASLGIYDAYDLRTVAQVEIPTARPFQNERTRVNQFQGSIRQLREFLAKDPGTGTNGSAPNSGAIRLPQFIDFVRENLLHGTSSATVLLLGNPLYVDPKEPSFSMSEGYFPTDGHLLASRQQTVYGLKERMHLTPGLVVQFGYFGEPWISELHRERIQRFWGLYFQLLGGAMGSFTPDLATVFKAVHAASMDPHPMVYALDQEPKRIAMLRLTRNLSASDWITRDTIPSPSSEPPRSLVGPIKIGIRWRGEIDLDLYAAPRRGGEVLFFDHPRSPEGYFYKDHRASPDRDYEYIEFETAVDVRELDAAVNFYAGSAATPVTGEVRVELGGRIYAGTFQIAAQHGNEGRSGPSQKDYWAPIDLRRLLKLEEPPALRAQRVSGEAFPRR